jgi:archaellum biogenesis ATPase FlaH
LLNVIHKETDIIIVIKIRGMNTLYLEDLTAKINNCMEDLEYATARIFIEENIQLLTENKNMLNNNARELLKFILEMQKEGNKPLTRKDMAIINSINSFANKFDLRGLKLMVKENASLLIRKEIPLYLSADAKILLDGMGAISKEG